MNKSISSSKTSPAVGDVKLTATKNVTKIDIITKCNDNGTYDVMYYDVFLNDIYVEAGEQTSITSDTWFYKNEHSEYLFYSSDDRDERETN